MVEQLEQLLLRPWRAGLGAQVIQDQERRVAQLLKEVIIAVSLCGLKAARRWSSRSGTVIKTAGSPRPHAIGNCRGQVRLAAAIGPGEQQPAFRFLGISNAGFEGAAQVDGTIAGGDGLAPG